MLVSVIIPSYGQPQFLDQAIASVQRQDYRQLEIIVVDDRGEDSSLAIARHVARGDDRIRVLRHDRNRGLGASRNTGLVESRGELLCFLDADDHLTPNSITVRVEAYSRARATNRKVVGAYGDWVHITEQTTELGRLRPSRTGLPMLDRSSFSGENLFICSAPVVRRDTLFAVGGFPEGLPMLEDFTAWARVIASGGLFVPTDHVVSTYRQRRGSMLRTNGVVMADYVRAICRDIVERGVPITDGGVLSKWLGGEDPHRAGRLSWLRSANFGSDSFDSGDASTIHRKTSVTRRLEDASPALAEFTNRDAGSLSAVAGRFTELPARTRPPMKADVVLVPTTLEEAIEVVAMAEGLRAGGVEVAVGELTSGDRSNVWALDLADLEVVPVHAFDNADRHWVLFRDDLETAQKLIGRVGSRNVTLRSSGLQALEVWRPLAARRFRSARSVLMRSLLEVAELGDRRHTLLGSGVPLGIGRLWGSRARGEHGVVLVSDALADFAAIDAWVSVASSVAREFTSDIRILVAPRLRSRIAGFRSALVDFVTLSTASFVISPVAHETSLLELAGTRCVLFHPSRSPDVVAPAWLEAHTVAADRHTLEAAVSHALDPTQGETDERDQFVRSLAQWRVFDGDIAKFGAALLAALSEPIGAIAQQRAPVT